MPRTRAMASAPAVTLRRPSAKSASASTVAVVVPSPATSEVLLAASLTSLAPMFWALSASSISSATVTPSLVTVGAPQPLSSTAVRPRGPRVLLTAAATLLTPARRALRASVSKINCLAAINYLLSLPLSLTREYGHKPSIGMLTEAGRIIALGFLCKCYAEQLNSLVIKSLHN